MTLAPLEEHQLLKIKIDSLKFDETNPNELTAEQMDGLRKSMKKFGYLTPIIVDQDNMIADGEHRALIYKEFGFTEIPGFKVTLKDDIERRMLRQVMNKLHGEHDRQRDANELLQIFESKQLDELAQLIAQPREGLESILTKYHGIEFQHEDNFDVDQALQDLTPVTQLGDIWQLGNHRIICADCTDKRSLDKLLENKKANLIFTDPPYGVEYEGNSDNESEALENDEKKNYQDFFSKVLEIIDYCLEINSVFYLFHSHTQQQAILNSLEAFNFQVKAMLVWAKNAAVWSGILNRMGIIHYKQQHEPIYYCKRKDDKTKDLKWFGGYDESTILNYDRPLNNSEHPTTKPIQLYSRLIKNSSNPNDLIFDPTLGSGSTLIACEQTNRICYGVEIDPHYCDVIVKRWEQYTGEKAEKGI